LPNKVSLKTPRAKAIAQILPNRTI